MPMKQVPCQMKKRKAEERTTTKRINAGLIRSVAPVLLSLEVILGSMCAYTRVTMKLANGLELKMAR